MKKIQQVDFNWFFSPADNSAHWDHRTVGQDGVINIGVREYGDAPSFYIVNYEDGRQEWIYNVNRLYWNPVPASETPIDPLAEFDLPF